MKGTVCLITGVIGGIVGMVLSLFWFLLGAISFQRNRFSYDEDSIKKGPSA